MVTGTEAVIETGDLAATRLKAILRLVIERQRTAGVPSSYVTGEFTAALLQLAAGAPMYFAEIVEDFTAEHSLEDLERYARELIADARACAEREAASPADT